MAAERCEEHRRYVAGCPACRTVSADVQRQWVARNKKWVADGGWVELSHGSGSTYSNWGCRCDLCAVAWSSTQRRSNRSRAERLRADPTLALHGSASTYTNWGCRCDECRSANTAAKRTKGVTT